MNNTELSANVFKTSNVLNNSGGPRSRVRSEKINESYLSSENATHEGYFGIEVPDDIDDLETWLLHFAEKIGWKGWEVINKNVELPNVKMMVFNELDYEVRNRNYSKVRFLTTAIILSMCNPVCYLPQGPRIFTRSRLERKIRLTKINLKTFYEME